MKQSKIKGLHTILVNHMEFAMNLSGREKFERGQCYIGSEKYFETLQHDIEKHSLIAAAPEMLKALEAILEDAENFLSGEAQVNLSLTLVEAAIAKAKGGE